MRNISKISIEESWKKVRTNLLYCEGKIFAVASLSANEGKTTVTLNLAKQLSLLGKKVLVIDSDLKKPSIKKALGVTKKVSGLSEFLSNQKEVQIFSYEENFDVIFAGKTPPNSSELLSSSYMTDFLNKAKEKYDYILIDTPPLSGSIDCQIIGALVDGMILVIKTNFDKVQLLNKAIKEIKDKNIKIIGAILNMAKKGEDDYYGYY